MIYPVSSTDVEAVVIAMTRLQQLRARAVLRFPVVLLFHLVSGYFLRPDNYRPATVQRCGSTRRQGSLFEPGRIDDCSLDDVGASSEVTILTVSE